uniref:SUEL-type lectin domain-containing protein n=1 Tax=Cyprinus carpio TaxID=7962 RepID=A0A8C2DA10_CYPCA
MSLSLNRCNGLRECELNTQGLAPKDPCFGTYKYYTTNYICIPAGLDFFSLFLQFLTIFFFYLHIENGRIQINTANYGRTDKTTCSEGRPSEQLQNTNCYSPNALAPVCNGLESCEVCATHTVFTDPCFGTYKYLAISYFCLPSGVCEYFYFILFFLIRFGTVISIHSANYGRTDSTTCSTGRPASQLCFFHILSLFRCEGKNNCSISASNSVFSDPCVGTFKYLYISYFCVLKCKCDCTEQ